MAQRVIRKAEVDLAKFNREVALPYALRLEDFESAMQDVYDFFWDVNTFLLGRGLQRLEDMIRASALSGMLSDMVTEALGKHSRTLTPNLFHNGHPDLIVRGHYPGNAVNAGEEGVEIKTSRKKGGAVDTHGGRDQWMCAWVYDIDNDPGKSAYDREPLRFHEIYLAKVVEADFRRNTRGERGTPTSTLHRDGIATLRLGWVYLNQPAKDSQRLKQAAAWRQG